MSYAELNTPTDVENNANEGTKIYFSLAETLSKGRFANHNKYFTMNNTRDAQNCQDKYDC